MGDINFLPLFRHFRPSIYHYNSAVKRLAFLAPSSHHTFRKFALMLQRYSKSEDSAVVQSAFHGMFD